MDQGGGAETVVDVDHTDARGARVEHSEERGNTAEAGSVSDRGRHGDHRTLDETGDHRWQCALHSGNHHQRARGAQPLERGKQAMDPGNTDIVDAVDRVSEVIVSNRFFLGHREIGCPGRHNRDRRARCF